MNSDLNWGPLSLRMIWGHPSKLNQSLSISVIYDVSVFLSLSAQRYPEYLSTRTRYSSPWKENRSVATVCIGVEECFEGSSVSEGKFDCCGLVC